MLAAPRTKTVGEAQKVFLVNLVEDGDHGLLDNLVFQGRDPQWALPSIFFLYVHSSRRLRTIHSAMNPTMEIDESILQAGLILLPRHSVYSRRSFPLQRVKALPQQIDVQMV